MRLVRSSSLSLAFLSIFVLALIGQSVTGYTHNNEELAHHGSTPISFLDFITASEFIVDVAENWQSEFLAVGAMVAFSIYLRQRGVPHHISSVESE